MPIPTPLPSPPISSPPAATSTQVQQISDQQKAKVDDFKKQSDSSTFLKEQENLSSVVTSASVASIMTPILTRFINTEKIANSIINKLINDTKAKLKDKGRVEVVNGAITFTPKDKQNYQRFKDNFDRKVASLKKSIATLKQITSTVTTVLSIVRAILAALKLRQLLIKKKLQTEAGSAAANLSSLGESKPADAKYTLDDRRAQDNAKPLQDKIDQYTAVITYINAVLKIFKTLINDIEIKLNTLSFTIINSNTPQSSDLNKSLQSASLSNNVNNINKGNIEQETTQDINVGDKQYTIKVITTLSGTYQAVAFDKFSLMKITQTAPSKLKTPDQLLDEIKQILGQ